MPVITRSFTDRNPITASPFSRKEEPREVRMGFCDEVEDDQARVIAATVGDGARHSIYAPNGQAVGSPAYEYKMEWYRAPDELPAREGRVRSSGSLRLRRFQCRAERRGRARSRRSGAAPSCARTRSARPFARCSELGLADTLRLHHPEPGIFSWWDYRMLAFPKNRGLRIDAILASETLAAHCTMPAGSSARCAKGKNRPITRRSGRSSICRRTFQRKRSTSRLCGAVP